MIFAYTESGGVYHNVVQECRVDGGILPLYDILCQVARVGAIYTESPPQKLRHCLRCQKALDTGKIPKWNKPEFVLPELPRGWELADFLRDYFTNHSIMWYAPNPEISTPVASGILKRRIHGQTKRTFYSTIGLVIGDDDGLVIHSKNKRMGWIVRNGILAVAIRERERYARDWRPIVQARVRFSINKTPFPTQELEALLETKILDGKVAGKSTFESDVLTVASDIMLERALNGESPVVRF